MKAGYKVKHFEDLIVWRRAMDLTEAIYRISSDSMFARDYGLKDQIRKASISITSNIAEGYERYSRKEFRQFLSIARGSTGEVRSQLYLARRLKYIDREEFEKLNSDCARISLYLGRLRNSIKT